MKVKIKKFIKWVLKPLFSIYAVIVVGFFFLCIFYGLLPPFAAFAVTDNILVSGPIKRTFYSVSSDKKMIANFKQHRKDFERITELIRDQCVAPNAELDTLIKKIQAIKIESRAPIGGNWLPNPYSAESMTKEITNPQEQCKFGSVGFFLEKYPYDDFWKGIIYLPQPPIINNGILQYPRVEPSYLRGLKSIDPEGQVLTNLDYVLGFFRQDQECKFKQIENQWFLFVCPDDRAYYYIH